MRKIFFVFAVFGLCILLCGCSFTADSSGENREYLVASMGFDNSKNGIKITVEAVAVNSEDAEGKKRILIEGEGETPKKAIESAQKKATQPFNLSHCGVIAIDYSFPSEKFAEICDYCYNTDEITFSVYMVTAKNCRELLSAEPVSSVAVGYDIMSMLAKESKITGEEFRNSLYEVEAKRQRGDTVKLPFFALSGDYMELTHLIAF